MDWVGGFITITISLCLSYALLVRCVGAPSFLVGYGVYMRRCPLVVSVLGTVATAIRMPIASLLLYTIASMLWYSWHKKRVCAQYISSMHAFHRTAFGLPSRRPVVKTLNDILDNETASTQRTKQSQGKFARMQKVAMAKIVLT